MANKIDGSLPGAGRVAGPTAVPERAGAERSKPVDAVGATDSVRLTSEAASLQALSRKLAAEPSMDMAKIQAVRSALESGSYQIDPQEIASRLAALERDLAK